MYIGSKCFYGDWRTRLIRFHIRSGVLLCSVRKANGRILVNILIELSLSVRIVFRTAEREARASRVALPGKLVRRRIRVVTWIPAWCVPRKVVSRTFIFLQVCSGVSGCLCVCPQKSVRTFFSRARSASKPGCFARKSGFNQ